MIKKKRTHIKNQTLTKVGENVLYYVTEYVEASNKKPEFEIIFNCPHIL